jgi:hypothetical protein
LRALSYLHVKCNAAATACIWLGPCRGRSFLFVSSRSRPVAAVHCSASSVRIPSFATRGSCTLLCVISLYLFATRGGCTLLCVICSYLIASRAYMYSRRPSCSYPTTKDNALEHVVCHLWLCAKPINYNATSPFTSLRDLSPVAATAVVSLSKATVTPRAISAMELVPGALPPFYPLRESQQNHRDTSSRSACVCRSCFLTAPS